MVLLLDTHILLWALDTPRRLPEDLRTTLADPDHEVCFSAASIWEIAVKAALKRVNFRYRPDEIANAARQTGIVEVCVSASQAARVVDLPPPPQRSFRPPVDCPSSLPAGPAADGRRDPDALFRAGATGQSRPSMIHAPALLKDLQCLQKTLEADLHARIGEQAELTCSAPSSGCSMSGHATSRRVTSVTWPNRRSTVSMAWT